MTEMHMVYSNERAAHVAATVMLVALEVDEIAVADCHVREDGTAEIIFRKAR